jgi:hypothetical protein
VTAPSARAKGLRAPVIDFMKIVAPGLEGEQNGLSEVFMGVSRRWFSLDPTRGCRPLVPALLFLLGGCTSNPPPPAAPPPQQTVTPSNFTVLYIAPNELLLTWTEPTAPHDGNRLEVADSRGSFQPIGDLIPAGKQRIIIFSQSDVPELAVLTFRLTSMRQGSSIGPPATAQFTEPLRPISVSAVTVGRDIQLYWTTASTLGDHIEIRRTHQREPSGVVVDDPSAAGSYPLSRNSRVDTDILDAMTYDYTFTLKAGQVAGDPTCARVYTYPAPPTDLVARVHAGNVELRWTNRTDAATEIQVLRGSGLQPGGYVDIVAHLAPDAGSYREQAPDAGQYTYTISAQVPVYGTGFAWASVDVLPASQHFDTELQAPGGSPLLAALHSSGEWLLCQSSPRIDPLPPDGPDAGGAIPPTQFLGDMWADPCLMLDGSGRPHSVFVAAGRVYHVWFDGSAWATEEIASRPGGLGDLRATLDSHDALHIVWLQAGFYADAGFEYAHRSGAGWVTESLPPIAIAPDDTPLNLAVDRSDTVHVLWAPRLDHLQRSAAGTWTLEQIPVALAPGEHVQDSIFLPDLNTGPAVLFMRVPATEDSHSIELTVLDAGTWSAPEFVTSMRGNGNWLLAATSADGTRLATAIAQGPRAVFVRGDAGWTSFDLGATSPAWVLGLALDDQDRLHWLETSSGGYQLFERFDEAP